MVTALLGATAVVASGCGVSFQALPQLGGTSGGYSIHARFNNVQNLGLNAQVRDGDSTIGKVTKITAANYQAIVTMQIKKGVHLPANTLAQARFNAPLGDEYVELTPPTSNAAPILAPGQTLAAKYTSGAPTVPDTLAALATVLYGGGLGQAETVVSELNTMLGGNGQQVKLLLRQVNQVVGSLAANDPAIDAALQAVNGLAGQLNGGSSQLVQALNTLPAAAQTLSAENGQFDQLLKNVQSLTPATLNVLAQSGQDIITDLRQAAPVSQQLASIQADLGSDFANITKLTQGISRIAPAGYIQAMVYLYGELPNQFCYPNITSAQANKPPSTDSTGTCNSTAFAHNDTEGDGGGQWNLPGPTNPYPGPYLPEYPGISPALVDQWRHPIGTNPTSNNPGTVPGTNQGSASIYDLMTGGMT